MSTQFENPEAPKLEDETAATESADQKIQEVAEKAARKATETTHEYDKDRAKFPI